MMYKNNYDFNPNVKYWLDKGRAIILLIRHKLRRQRNYVDGKAYALAGSNSYFIDFV